MVYSFQQVKEKNLLKRAYRFRYEVYCKEKGWLNPNDYSSEEESDKYDCQSKHFAAFDKNGKYLYFTASTDTGPTTGWLDMSSVNRPVSRSVYVVVLNREDPSPLAPESDEEKIRGDSEKPFQEGESDAGEAEKKEVAVKVDAEGIDQRILALPIPAKNYLGLRSGKDGVLFLLEAPQVIGEEAIHVDVHKFMARP